MSEDPSAPSDPRESQAQIRGSTLLLGGRVMSMALNLLTQVVMLRTLTKDSYGAFAYGLSFLFAVRILITIGHSRSITRFLAIYDEVRDYGRLFGTLLMEALLIGGGAAVLFAGALLFRDQLTGTLVEDPLAVSLLPLIVLLGALEALDDILEGLCAVFARPRAILFRKHLAAPLLRLGAVLLLTVTGAGVRFLATGYVVAGVAGIAFYAGLVSRILRQNQLLSRVTRKSIVMPFREITAFSVPLLSHELVYLCMNTVSIVLLGRLSGTTAVGAFRAILPAAGVNHFVVRSFTLLFMPMAARMYARRDRAGLRHAYWQTAAWLTVLTFPVFALTGPFAKPVTVFLFGARYGGSGTYLSILAVGMYLNAAFGFNAEVLQVHARLRYLLAVNVGVAALNIALAAALIPPLGALGVAVATGSTFLLQNVLNQAGLTGDIGVGVVNREVLPLYATVGGTAAALWAVEGLLGPAIPVVLLLAAAATLVVVLAGRRVLDVESTFPELLRLPLVSRFLRPHHPPATAATAVTPALASFEAGGDPGHRRQ